MAITRRAQALGQWGEDKAAAFLEQQGLVILDRNVKTRMGEIDILAFEYDSAWHKYLALAPSTERGSFIIVEVKTRIADSLDYAAETRIDRRRYDKLVRGAREILINRHQEHERYRIDVISIVVCPTTRQIRLRYLPAFNLDPF